VALVKTLVLCSLISCIGVPSPQALAVIHFVPHERKPATIGGRSLIGRLSEEYTGGNPWAASIFGYDAMGRVTLNNQCTPAVCGSSNFFVSYGYDLLGDMIGAVNGAGVGITYTYDSAARPISVTSNLADSQHPATLAQVAAGVGYYPTGQLRAMTLGNGLTESSWFDPRGGLERRNLNSTGAIVSGWGADPSGTIEDQGYAFGTWGSTNNGNVTAWYSYRQNFYHTYTYDSVNRLSTMSSSNDPSGCTGIQWTYDAWGDLTNQNQTGGSCPVFHATFSQGNNRMDPGTYGFTYDAAGNLLYDGTTTYTYDAENRIISASNAISGTATYIYDAEGRRVRKAAGATTDYVYDLSGHVVAEYPFGGAAPSYVYLNGQLLAEYANSTTYFVYKDHLGDTRLLTGIDQSIAECDDYVPFGERLSYSTCPSTSVTTHKFTGQEHDSESGNDYFGARYYGSSMGRFLSPDDPLADQDPSDPQSWNLYGYVRNNPVRNTDPSGHNCVYNHETGQYENDSEGGETCGDAESPAQQNFSSTTVNGCEGAGAVDCLAFDISDLTSAPSLSQVGVNGIEGALTIEGILSIPSLIRDVAGSVNLFRTAKTAATAATAAVTEATEISEVVAKATSAVGNQSVKVSSREAALAAAKEFVGPGSRPITDNFGGTGQIVGEVSADGTRVARWTSIDKPQPYINLENTTTGGNPHVRF